MHRWRFHFRPITEKNTNLRGEFPNKMEGKEHAKIAILSFCAGNSALVWDIIGQNNGLFSLKSIAYFGCHTVAANVILRAYFRGIHYQVGIKNNKNCIFA